MILTNKPRTRSRGDAFVGFHTLFEHSQVTTSIREVIQTLWPDRFEPGALRDDVPLGEEGLGLDSIELVELIFVCEERHGPAAIEALIASTPITVARMAACFPS